MKLPESGGLCWRIRGGRRIVPAPFLVAGIVNVTPDSFSDGGRYSHASAARARVLEVITQGAGMVDLGAESTRPGAEDIGHAEEWRRLEPVLRETLDLRAAHAASGTDEGTGRSGGSGNAPEPDAWQSGGSGDSPEAGIQPAGVAVGGQGAGRNSGSGGGTDADAQRGSALGDGPDEAPGTGLLRLPEATPWYRPLKLLPAFPEEECSPGVSAPEDAARNRKTAFQCRSLPPPIVPCPFVVAVDTWRAETAAAALALRPSGGAGSGLDVINDVSGGSFDPGMVEVLAAFQPGYVLGHSPSRPRDMQRDPRYTDVVEDLLAWFSSRMDALVRAGLSEDRIVLDPCIGFGKNLEHTLDIIRAVPRFLELGRPLYFGISRKSFLGALTGLPLDLRDSPTQTATALLAASGVAVHRVHQVAETVATLSLVSAFLSSGA